MLLLVQCEGKGLDEGGIAEAATAADAAARFRMAAAGIGVRGGCSCCCTGSCEEAGDGCCCNPESGCHHLQPIED